MNRFISLNMSRDPDSIPWRRTLFVTKAYVSMGALTPAMRPMKLIVPPSFTALRDRLRFSPPTTSITWWTPSPSVRRRTSSSQAGFVR